LASSTDGIFLTKPPWLRNTSGIANSSEHRKYIDVVLEEELGLIYIGIRRFTERFFGGVTDLETTSESVFKQEMRGSDNPLFW
jgi:hypothetical protein